MKKLLILFYAVLLAFSISPLWSDDDFDKWLYGVHLAFSPEILYLSWDAFYLPEDVVFKMTTVITGEEVSPGIEDASGFINFFDIGVHISPFDILVGFAEIGLDLMYIFSKDSLALDQKQFSFGANFRLGAGLKSDWFGIMLTGTAIFPSFDELIDTISASTCMARAVREAAWEKIQLIPAVMLVIYI